MHKIYKRGLYALTLAAVIVLAPNVILQVFADGTSINVQPTETIVPGAGLMFQINITVSQVINLGAWDIQLYYPNSLLNATNVVEGPFLKEAGDTLFLISSLTNSYNATCGKIRAACTLTGNVTGASGSGTLATIAFKALSGGDGNLTFGDTVLQSQSYPNFLNITHTTNDGMVAVGFPHVAVTNVVPSKTVVGWGCQLSTEVTAENLGGMGLSFNVTLYASRLVVTTDNIHLYASEQYGWGLTPASMTSPGPTITVHRGDLINLTLSAQDLAPKYNFFVDYIGNKTPSPNEPKSPDFYSPYRQTINYQFTADTCGTFTYYCQYYENVMYGTFTVAPTPVQTIVVGNQSIFLNSGQSGNLKYVWIPSGISSKGKYNLTACPNPVSGEVNSGNNNFTYCNVTVTIPGDITGDGWVGPEDLMLIAFNWNRPVPPAPANADIYGDGKIDPRDLMAVAFHWNMRISL